jgi:hypothetical protein
MLFRVKPGLPVTAMKSYTVAMPLATHFRPATCAEYECPDYLHGWVTVVPADSPAAEYIRHDRSRRWTEARQPGGLAEFAFEAGQQGFAGPRHEHLVPNGRPERFIERGGDHRGNPRGDVREHSADTWTDSFANHQDRLSTAHERG